MALSAAVSTACRAMTIRLANAENSSSTFPIGDPEHPIDLRHLVHTVDRRGITVDTGGNVLQQRIVRRDNRIGRRQRGQTRTTA